MQVDPEATEPKTFTMPYGGKPPMINVNPDKEE